VFEFVMLCVGVGGLVVEVASLWSAVEKLRTARRRPGRTRTLLAWVHVRNAVARLLLFVVIFAWAAAGAATPGNFGQSEHARATIRVGMVFAACVILATTVLDIVSYRRIERERRVPKREAADDDDKRDPSPHNVG
jgi:hypothetical protein